MVICFILSWWQFSWAQFVAARGAHSSKPCFPADAWSQALWAGCSQPAVQALADFYLVARVRVHRQQMCLWVSYWLSLPLGCEHSSSFCDKCTWHVGVCLIPAETCTNTPSDFCGSRSGAWNIACGWPSPALSYRKAGVPQDTKPRGTLRKNIKW